MFVYRNATRYDCSMVAYHAVGVFQRFSRFVDIDGWIDIDRCKRETTTVQGYSLPRFKGKIKANIIREMSKVSGQEESVVDLSLRRTLSSAALPSRYEMKGSLPLPCSCKRQNTRGKVQSDRPFIAHLPSRFQSNRWSTPTGNAVTNVELSPLLSSSRDRVAHEYILGASPLVAATVPSNAVHIID